MLDRIDLRELAELSAPERAFVTLYLSGPDALGSLDDRAQRVRALLAGDAAETEHFERGLQAILDAFGETPPQGPMAVFACWALDLLVGYRLSVAPPDVLWVGPSPYLRPLAELQDEHTSFALVAIDHDEATIHLVSGYDLADVERVRGGIKNHVKKGGWSQKRYQRRRQNEILHYTKEVAEVLERIVREADIERIVVLGGDQATHELVEALPDAVRDRIVGREAVDLAVDDEELVATAREHFDDQERADEASLWHRIRGEALAGGLAATGPSAVLTAAGEGRVEIALVDREARPKGLKCRDCELVAAAKPQQCPRCKSASVFAVDLVDEIVERVARTGGWTEFADPIEGLSEVGGVAALLRY